ncbi:polymorphic toxin-type HINT domain-containing protein [Streptomyces sp. NPDC052023]|uniref:polymorphic toxin-type HINT domain-containing protein n=1 Tax=Streptomyces sp. NPDC052023 TaxID=3365681 RepID=UPI0037D528B2
MNGYAYADNSPVTLSDPSGLESCYGYGYCAGYGSPGGPSTYPHETGNKAEDDATSDVNDAAANVASAQAQQSTAKQRIKTAGKALVAIARDILGVDAALDCISSGDVGACGETLLNIAGSFAGGLAGKILAKYGVPWNWAKGAKLLKRVTGLIGDLIGGVKDLYKANKTLGKARAGLAKAQDRLAEARKKAVAAFRKKGCHSFLPGTKVLLANGHTKPIEKVVLGDKVVTTDPETGKTTTREVAGTIVTEDDKSFSDLTVKTASGKTQALVATTTHPFWVESEQAWVKAGNLTPGMKLRTPTGDTVEVTGNRYYEKRQRTHDLTITQIHAYYVLAGATPVLVHNCDEKLDFVHGTTSTHADNIEANGLSGTAARANAHGGSLNRPGSLFTYRVTPTDKETLSATASFAGTRTGPGERAAILIFQMCRCEYDRLSAAGHITTRVTDEVSGRVEHIFDPEAMSSLRQAHRIDF